MSSRPRKLSYIARNVEGMNDFCVYVCVYICMWGVEGCAYVCVHMHAQMISKSGELRLCLTTPQKQNEANSYENFLHINKSENL